MVEQSAEVWSLPFIKLVSGAFHDALLAADVCPSGMVFVLSVGGISHHPSEYISPEHLTAETRVSSSSIYQLAMSERNH